MEQQDGNESMWWKKSLIIITEFIGICKMPNPKCVISMTRIILIHGADRFVVTLNDKICKNMNVLEMQDTNSHDPQQQKEGPIWPIFSKIFA